MKRLFLGGRRGRVVSVLFVCFVPTFFESGRDSWNCCKLGIKQYQMYPRKFVT